ncbi:MAG: hypothetical protein JXB30_11030 [Anaerolineae bacterium]|nr:hypothetical protein [Anaerolineae bacterium]
MKRHDYMEAHTAERLEEMTDDAKFERLATLILRKADSRCEAIMRLGMNARGQPIAAPNDGFCQVPGSDPPQFLWVQHTIENRDRLRNKWLSEDVEKPGDLVKAAWAADKLRSQFPAGKFILILSTNQRLPTEKKKDLAPDVYIAAKDKDLDVIIWEQSRYSDFLDFDPDGQWFRKEFFGTEVERISKTLLADLSRKSLAGYASRQFTSPTTWVTRQLDERIGQQPGETLYTVKLILGESGFGKSAAAYRLLERYIEAGGYGLYIPEQIIEEAVSLEDVLRRAFRGLCPSLLLGEIENIPSYLSDGSPFIIVVDDINQVSNPRGLIRKLVQWGQQPYLIICPVWPRFWKLVGDVNTRAKVDVISISRMPFAEAIEAVRRVAEVAECRATAIDIRTVTDRLQGDPLLIGTFGVLLAGTSTTDVVSLTNDVVEAYIAQCVKDAANSSEDKYFEHEYYEALDLLAATMLQRKALYPQWNAIEEWLQSNPKQANVIRDLANHEKICQVSANGEFRFQHDRFLEHFSIRAIGPLLAHPAEHQDVLADPYYAELIGQALVKYPQSEAVLDQMLEHPLVLASSIQAMGIPTTDYHCMIVEKMQYWVQQSGSKHQTPEALRGAVANCFINTDSPAVLDIVHTDFGLEVPWFGNIARLRNGDLESGIKLFALLSDSFFSDGYLQDSFVIELVEHAKQYHGEQLQADLRDALSTVIEERNFRGMIILASYLGFTGLQEAIVSSWHQQSDRARNLDVTFLAVLRTSEAIGENPHLDTIMGYWAEMPDIEEEKRLEYQRHIADGIHRLLGNRVDEGVVLCLIEQAHKHPQLSQPIAHICGGIDLPCAIEFAVREAALREDWRGNSSLTHWASLDNPSLSPASVSLLQEMWKSEENSDAVRQVAFQVWLDNVDRDTIQVLPFVQPISACSPLHIRALRERALLGDTTCEPGLLEQLEAHPTLYSVLPPVWSERLKQAVSARLQSLSENIPADFSGGEIDEHFIFATMMTQIPATDAENLLSDHWEYLCYSRLFLQAAIFVGTPRTLALVDATIGDYPHDVDPLKYLDFIYGFCDRVREKCITLNHLKHLEPYIARLSKHQQHYCADFCYRQGGEYVTWCAEHLPSEVNQGCRLRYMSSEDDVLQRLNEDTTHLPNHTLSVLDDFQKNHKPAEFLNVLRRWLQDNPTWQKVEAAARCLEQIGSRADVAMLDVSLEYEWEKRHIAILRDSTMFAVCRRTLS